MLAEKFEKHTTLWRAYPMESEVHRLLWTGRPEQGLGQCMQNLKAISAEFSSDLLTVCW